MRCFSLRSIVRRAQRGPSAEIEYVPIRHDAPAVHVNCGGVVHDGNCEHCGPVTEIIPSAPCDGHKFPIR